MKNANRFPKGWDEEHVPRVLAHYENQTEEEAAAEDDAMFSGKHGTVMVIPGKLVSQVRTLIARSAGRTKWRTGQDATSPARPSAATPTPKRPIG